MFLLCLFYPICQLQYALATFSFKFSGKLIIHTESGKALTCYKCCQIWGRSYSKSWRG